MAEPPTIAFDLDLKRDPLRVLESTLPVVEAARHVRIVPEKIESTAEMLAGVDEPAADWSVAPHPIAENDEQLANLVLVLDALNFCFWSLPGSAWPRWQVTWGGTTWDGYWALAAALRRAVEQGRPIWDAEYLATLTEDEVAGILAGDPGSEEIPLLHARLQHLQEVGEALLATWEGSFLRAIRAAHHSAPALVRLVLGALPSFRDVAPWGRRDVYFYKRAQILVADLHGAFEGGGPGEFHDLHTLTAFADYKVPQVLRRHGILEYAPALAATIAGYTLIPPDSDEEIEIRAATIWAVELLRQSLARRGRDMPAYQIDWALWQAGQTQPADAEPYHRTLTVWY